MVIEYICKTCKRTFSTRAKKALFCGSFCYGQSLKKRVTKLKICEFCKKEFQLFNIVASWFKKRRFCSRACVNKYRCLGKPGHKHTEEAKKRMSEIAKLRGTNGVSFRGYHQSEEAKRKIGEANRDRMMGENHFNWKGGIEKQNGYLLQWSPMHPQKDRHGYVRQHRLIVEQYIGRLLNKKEVVHHINKKCTDNSVNNLFIFRHDAAHQRWHAFLKRHDLQNTILQSNLNDLCLTRV